MNKRDFSARYFDALGKRFTILDETPMTREDLKLLSQDFNALYADALTSAPCTHEGGRYPQMGIWRCSICCEPVERRNPPKQETETYD